MSSDSVLLLDDDPALSESLCRALAPRTPCARYFPVQRTDNALGILERERPAVAIVDLDLDPARGTESGFEALSAIRRAHPDCRVLMLTGHSARLHAARALRAGAAGFLEKPADVARLASLVSEAFIHARWIRQSGEQSALADAPDLIGHSEAATDLRREIRFAASNRLNVLLIGETGSGKGVCARAIHAGSRRHGEMIRHQPSFGTADLVSSDLFGHARGAFTGACESRHGLIMAAHGGTLFLDEIDELPPATQVALLDALQERRIRPVGSDSERAADFRLICATNREISRSLSDGRLRPDFFHRIAQLVIRVPPLRERPEDVEPLAEHLLDRLRASEMLGSIELGEAARAKLSGYLWPGNIRELRNVVECAAQRASFAGLGVITEEHIRLGTDAEAQVAAGSFSDRVRRYKLALVREAFARHRGNQLRAAAELQLDRSTFRRLIRESGES